MSTSSVLFRSQRGYDASSNVTAVNTTLAAGTDNQAFCYDEQNRLVWAGASGTPSCGATLTAGTLGAASYTQTFAYDTLDRLTSGPLGSYIYGDSAHLHAVTSIGSGPTYTASYDAVGDMTCRAPDNTTTCIGTATGAQLGYDNEGRLTAWQNAPSSPTTTDGFLYDGAGNRVEQLVTVNGSITTTTTYVADGLEEVASNGVGTTLTKYFTGASGLPTAERVGTGGPLSYLATDGQGTISESLDSAGSVTSSQLYTPYGNARYSSGSSPTSIGYTGQRADGATGLEFYQARYYDPVAGQFASADTVADGLNRYGYVGGNPTTFTDPTGHKLYNGDDGDVAPHQSPSMCNNEPNPSICWQIVRTFHDPMTRKTLEFIAQSGTSIGMMILNWILNVGKTLGDAFIRWDQNKPNDPSGYSDSGGWIHMKPMDLYASASGLIHEAVESYYAIQHGIRTQASQQMDYVAEWFTGMFKSQDGRYINPDNVCGSDYECNDCDSDGVCKAYGSYGLAFQTWRETSEGKGYAGQPLIQSEVQFGHPIAPGRVLFRTGPFGLYLGSKAVNGGSIPALEAAYGQLFNQDFMSPFDPVLPTAV